MLIGLDTHKVTYEQARKLAQTKQLRDHLNKVQTGVVQRHFREQR
jgi:hypothetical protein